MDIGTETLTLFSSRRIEEEEVGEEVEEACGEVDDDDDNDEDVTTVSRINALYKTRFCAVIVTQSKINLVVSEFFDFLEFLLLTVSCLPVNDDVDDADDDDESILSEG